MHFTHITSFQLVWFMSRRGRALTPSRGKLFRGERHQTAAMANGVPSPPHAPTSPPPTRINGKITDKNIWLKFAQLVVVTFNEAKM